MVIELRQGLRDGGMRGILMGSPRRVNALLTRIPASSATVNDPAPLVDWQIEATGTNAPFLSGRFGVNAFVSGTTTDAPVVVLVDNLLVRTTGDA